MYPNPGPQNLPPPTDPNGPTPPAPASQPPAPQPVQAPQPQAQPEAPTPGPTTLPIGQVATPPAPGDQQTQTPQPADSAAASPSSPHSAEEAKKELRDAIQESNEVLATAATVMPFFFETYTIDRTKLTVSRRNLFGSAEVMSIRVEDVLNASATVGPILGSIQITNRIAAQSTTSIGPFWRRDALRLKRVTQGYVIAIQKQIDVSQLSSNELEHMLERLGEDDHSSTATAEPKN